MEDVAKFILEVGVLKHMKRTGWHKVGIGNPESVADHKLRAIVVGYMLAKMEKVDETKVMKMLMFHDIPEARIGDLNRTSKAYIDVEEAEERVVSDQADLLPEDVGEEYILLLKEFNDKKTKEAIVAKDADTLELAIQAHEYMLMGYKTAEHLLVRSKERLKTDSAKKLLEDALKSDSWWANIQKS